jgi:ABC-type nitrate/sulfonate/bicarbonate transport system permease component
VLKGGAIMQYITSTNSDLQKQQRTRTAEQLFFLIVFLVVYAGLPGNADGQQAVIQTPAVQATAGIPKSSQSLGQKSKSFPIHLSQRLVSLAVGTAIGTPVALIRCTRREIARQTKEAYTLGGVPKPLGYVSAVFFGVPSGVLSAAWYGTADGIVDSWINSKDEPYSKSSFSLKKLAF